MLGPSRSAGGPASGASEHPRSCPFGVCDGSGLVVDESNTARPCACRERLINRARSTRVQARIPDRYRGVSFDRNPIRDLDGYVLQHVRAYADHIDERLDAGSGLWIHGDVGTGKTSLAMLVSSEALAHNRSVAIYSAPQLLARLRQTFDSGSEDTYFELFHRLCAVDLLVLDDLGSERTTDWAREQLYSIVNERWQDEASVIVTSNAPDPERSRALAEAMKGVRRAKHERAPVERLLARFDALQDAVEELERGGDVPVEDPVTMLREQVGRRTVSRLIEICGDPIPIMGRDLRFAAAP